MPGGSRPYQSSPTCSLADVVIYLRRAEPLVLSLQAVHDLVKLVQVPVPQELVLNEVELTPGMKEGVAVALSREIHPPAGALLSVRAELVDWGGTTRTRDGQTRSLRN
jgi:hypothetical protein